jgi:hypothetical protein
MRPAAAPGGAVFAVSGAAIPSTVNGDYLLGEGLLDGKVWYYLETDATIIVRYLTGAGGSWRFFIAAQSHFVNTSGGDTPPTSAWLDNYAPYGAPPTITYY